ncbi:MAG: STAS domain-containing protein [Candidatus Acidiferrales bacterium]
MTMECNVRHIHDVTILDLKGRLSLGEALAFGPGSDVVLTDAIRNLAGQGHKKIVLNLAGVTYVDSSGVGQLVGALTSARSKNVGLKLINPVKQVSELLKMTKLYTVFDIRQDEAAAIDSFSSGAVAGA